MRQSAEKVKSLNNEITMLRKKRADAAYEYGLNQLSKVKHIKKVNKFRIDANVGSMKHSGTNDRVYITFNGTKGSVRRILNNKKDK